MSTKSACDRTRIKDPLPRPRGVEVVPIGQVAGMLGWSVSKLRRVDLFLKPFILADGTRLYDVDRVLAWARIEDDFVARSDLRKAEERRAIQKARRWSRGVRRWLRGNDVPDDRRLMAIGRFAVGAESFAQTLRSGFNTVVAHDGLRCMLELIGTAAAGLSAERRALYRRIPWDRVEALAALHKTWDGRLFRNGKDVIVPLLRRAGIRTGIRRIDEPQRSAGVVRRDARKRRTASRQGSMPDTSVRTDDQRIGDILEHAARAFEYAQALGDAAFSQVPRGDTRKHVTRGAMLQCLVIIGFAASGLSKKCRTKYPGIVWDHVIALRKLRGKPDRLIDFEYIRRALDELVPTLLKALQ